MAIVPFEKIGLIFYDAFMEMCPDLQFMFTSPREEYAAKLGEILGSIVGAGPCTYVYVYVRMCAYVYALISTSPHVRMCAYVYALISTSSLHKSAQKLRDMLAPTLSLYACIYLCAYVCMYACMYVCQHAYELVLSSPCGEYEHKLALHT
jgi:hypothetical protein